jgi:hypothetical protein
MLGDELNDCGTNDNAIGNACNVGGLFRCADAKANRDGQIGMGL